MAFDKKKMEMREEEEERKMAIKYADLMPEYLQLQKEVYKLRKQLQTAKLKKDNLTGVVRFLRHKYRMLKKTSPHSKASENGLVNQYTRTSPPVDQFESAAMMLKNTSPHSKASENGLVNQYARTSPPADQFESAARMLKNASHSKASDNGLVNQYARTSPDYIGKETAAITKFEYAMAPTYEETTATTKFQNAMVPTYEETIANAKYQYAMVPTYAEATATTKFQYTMAPVHEHTSATTKFQYAIVAPTHEKTSAFQESMPDANLSLSLCHNSKIDQLAATEFENILAPRRIMNPTFVQSTKPQLENNGLGTVKRPAILKNSSKEFVKPILGKRKISWADKISLTL